MRDSSSSYSESLPSAPFAAVAGVVLGVLASGAARGQTGGGPPSSGSAVPAASDASRSKAAGLASASAGDGDAPTPSASVAPPASASASASAAPAESSSAEPVPSASGSSAAPEDSAEPPTSASVEAPAAPSGSSSGSSAEPDLARPYPAGYPRPDSAPKAPERQWSPVARLEAGGSLSQGLDATNAATRGGGFYAGVVYPPSKDFVFIGWYGLSSGHVVERLPGNRIASFGVPNDIDVLETRHAFLFDVGYVGRLTDGPLRAFAMPLIGPRVVVFVNDVAPRWAFDADLALRAGVWVSDALEASTFFAFDPSIAKANDVPDVQGAVLSELRFGVGARFRTKGPIGVALGYEGDVVMLEHQKLSTHSLVMGLSYALEAR